MISKPYYLAFDCETGGVNGESLLTVFFLLLDRNLNEIDVLSLFTKPNNGVYQVTAGALKVNKINLIEHDKTAITYSKAGELLYKFLDKHSESGKTKLIPLGHNVFFDEMCVWGHLLSKPNYEKFVSYRRQDTGCIAQYLKDKGVIPESVTGSLASLVAHFNITTTDSEFHTAEGDTRLTVEVFKAMLKV